MSRKRITYGKILLPFRKSYASFLKTFKDPAAAQERLLEHYTNLYKSRSNSVELEFAFMFFADLRGEVIHYYLQNPALWNFLYNLEVKDLDGMKRMVKDFGSHEFKNIANAKELFFAVHVPNEREAWAFIYSITEKDYLYLRAEHSGYAYRMEEKDWKQYRKNDKDDEIFKAVSFGLNLMAYARAFPECVKDGVPSDILLGSGGGSRHSKVLKISDKILERETKDEEGRFVSPHFRRGHFRYFASDYFVNKKGTTRFIRETMVKGRAKTVVGTEDEAGERQT